MRLAEHFTRSREIKSTLRLQLFERGQHVMRPIDVRIERRETVRETLRHETLRRQVIALIELVTAEHMKDARVTLQTCSMQNQSILQMQYPPKSLLRRLERHSPHQTMNLIAEAV